MTPLNYNWILWFHDNKNKDWTIKGYNQIYKITTIEDFWEIFCRLNNDILSQGQFFIMKENKSPIWEHKDNIHGGCWSYKINKNDSLFSWTKISMILCGGTITQDYDDLDTINGLSLSPKKNFSIIKIWNSDKNKITNVLNEKSDVNLSTCLYKINKERKNVYN